MAEPKPKMKLFIDSEKKQLLFAEGEKECVDFFFHILALPVGSLGCLGKLRKSLEDLHDTYIEPNKSKDIFLNPQPRSGAKGGLVRGGVNYMISDELSVKPPSISDIITRIKKLKIKGVDVLREEQVTLGMEEAEKLLKASVEHGRVLTSVFKDIINK